MIPLTRTMPKRIRGGYDDALYKSTSFTVLLPLLNGHFFADLSFLDISGRLFITTA